MNCQFKGIFNLSAYKVYKCCITMWHISHSDTLKNQLPYLQGWTINPLLPCSGD
uniref:Uncharacterized protein n=1 Tax=Arundo donax TaxID=35708 RepID=A0A0A9AD17_ARUDO